MLLIRERLWPIVSESRPRPQPAGAAGPAARNTGRDAGNYEEIAKWDDDAECATCAIFLHLDERAEKHVQSLRDPVGIWKSLRISTVGEDSLPASIFGRSSSLCRLLM